MTLHRPDTASHARARAATHPAPPNDPVQWLQAWCETWAAGLDPAGTGARLRERRLAALIDTARRDSPFYRRRAPQARRLGDFEPVAKADLMSHFDDWATDRRITRRGADAAVADPGTIADGWLGRYMLWTSSGTSGQPGIFVQDSASLAAYDAIDALRLRGVAPVQAALGAWGLGRSYAYVAATGGHFAGHVSFERLRRIVPAFLLPRLDVISVLEPMTAVAARLQELQPGVLVTYPSCAVALAQMQIDAKLRIAPIEIWLGGEQVSAAQRGALQSAFGCAVRNAYGASEFYSIAFECERGRLHLNDDWVVLEALDAGLRPVAAGELSQVTLLTNLANRTQPLLRYRLDDSVRFVAEPCGCGSALPVIEVQGRADDVLSLPGVAGAAVTVLPLALQTVIEEAAGVTQFQVLRLPSGRLQLRLDPAVADAAGAWRRCRAAVAAFLGRHGVADTRLHYSSQPPLRERASGKLRRVLDAAAEER